MSSPCTRAREGVGPARRTAQGYASGHDPETPDRRRTHRDARPRAEPDVRVRALPAPLDGARPLGTALIFLVTPEAPVRRHRIRNEQLYHYYAGDPLELTLHLDDGTTEVHTIGADVLGGQAVQFRIPGNTFHTARVLGEWFLGGSTEWPGVVPADVELATNTDQQGATR